MVSFAGQPYIDVRADFNSFIPASVSDGLAERLVDHYLEWLLEHPHFQDKVEFEVVFTCRTPDFMDHARARLMSHGFSEADVRELEAGLAQITRGALDRADRDMEQIALLEERFTRIMAAGL